MRGAVIIAVVLGALAGRAEAQTQTPGTPSPPPAPAAAAMSDADIRELLDAARATAKAARENVDYNRVVPDILTQILGKLDKIEDKLDKLETAVKAAAPRRATGQR